MFRLRRVRAFRWLAVFTLLAVQLLLALESPEVEAKSSSSNNIITSPSPAQITRTNNPSDCAGGAGFGLTVPENGLLSQLKNSVGGNIQISCHIGTGKVRFLGVEPSNPIPAPANLGPTANPEQVARGFMATYGSLFGLKDQANELSVMLQSSDRGRNFVRFQQVYRNIPVVAGEIIVQTNQQQQPVSVGGELSPNLQLDVTPKISAAQAQQEAQKVIARNYGVPAANVTSTAPALWIYDARLLNSQAVRPVSLVWRLEVSNSDKEPVRELVLVDAQTGNVALHFNQIAESKDRRVCNQNNIPTNPDQLDCTNPVRVEGNPPSGNQDVDLAYDYAGATYDFYFNNFGRDSLNGQGLPLKSTVKYCPPGQTCSAAQPYQNAFWNGTQMYYGDGFASADDVVGHELTHGFTQFTSNLLYYFQSGAINESMSDVFGEFIDLTDGLGNDSAAVRWLLGEDIPGIGAIRSMKNPPQFGDPDRVLSPNYTTDPNFLDNGGVHTNSGVNNKAAYLMVDGDTFNGQTITGLGLPKTAQIYYETETHLLSSGSDYQDLYDYLQQACKNLIGTNNITANDCDQVRKAVTATEMNLTPTGFLSEAPVCDNNLTPNNVFYDNLENPNSNNWTFSSAVGGNIWHYLQLYATSGKLSLVGDDIATIGDSRAAMTSAVTIPTQAFMHFRHYYTFDNDTTTAYDGGVLEYTTNGGNTWTDAGNLFINNGYNATLSNNFGNPLGGRQAFGKSSTVYYSSRLNLSSLVGQNVQFRFRVGSDNSFGSDGWFIDDVRIYTCGNPVSIPTATSMSPATLTAGSPAFTLSVYGTNFIPASVVRWNNSDRTTTYVSSTELKAAIPASDVTTGGTASVTVFNPGNGGGTSNALAFTIATACDVLLVTRSDDNGGCGTLRDAAAAAAGGQVKTISFPVNTPLTIQLNSALTLPAGVILGSINNCSANGPLITINPAPSYTGNGLTLQGSKLTGIQVSGFSGKPIVLASRNNSLKCVKLHQ